MAHYFDVNRIGSGSTGGKSTYNDMHDRSCLNGFAFGNIGSSAVAACQFMYDLLGRWTGVHVHVLRRSLEVVHSDVRLSIDGVSHPGPNHTIVSGRSVSEMSQVSDYYTTVTTAPCHQHYPQNALERIKGIPPLAVSSPNGVPGAGSMLTCAQ